MHARTNANSTSFPSAVGPTFGCSSIAFSFLSLGSADSALLLRSHLARGRRRLGLALGSLLGRHVDPVGRGELAERGIGERLLLGLQQLDLARVDGRRRHARAAGGLV